MEQPGVNMPMAFLMLKGEWQSLAIQGDAERFAGVCGKEVSEFWAIKACV